MQTASAAYAAAITANIEETCFKGSFEVEPVGIRENVTASATSSLPVFSKIEQTYDETEKMGGRYATFEKNRFPLDGSAFLYEEGDTGQHGWWGDALSDENGVWANPEILRFTFSRDYDLIGLALVFDDSFLECAEDFSLSFYDASDNLLGRTAVTGNTKVAVTAELLCQNVRKAELAVEKWSYHGIRRAKVADVYFGQKFLLDDDNVLSFELTENAGLLEDNLPSNEFTITVENTGERLNPVNPTGLIAYLRRKMPISAFLGVRLADGSVEYVNCGQYLIYEFPTSTEDYRAKFVARSPAGFLEDTYRPAGFGTAPAGNIARDIFQKAGITDFHIDPSFESVTVNRYIKPASFAAALQYLANACGGYVRQERSGRVSLLPLPQTGTAGLAVGYDKMTEKPSIKQESRKTGVTVACHSWGGAGFGDIDEFPFQINGQVKTVTLDYGGPHSGVGASVTGGTILSAVYYTDEAALTLSGTAGETVVYLYGTKMEDTQTAYTADNPDIGLDDLKNTQEVDNPFICTLEDAERLAGIYLSNMDLRLSYEFPWRGDMRLEGGDIVEAENDFEDRNIVVTKNTIKWEKGVLSGQIAGKGETS